MRKVNLVKWDFPDILDPLEKKLIRTKLNDNNRFYAYLKLIILFSTVIVILRVYISNSMDFSIREHKDRQAMLVKMERKVFRYVLVFVKPKISITAVQSLFLIM